MNRVLEIGMGDYLNDLDQRSWREPDWWGQPEEKPEPELATDAQEAIAGHMQAMFQQCIEEQGVTPERAAQEWGIETDQEWDGPDLIVYLAIRRFSDGACIGARRLTLRFDS